MDESAKPGRYWVGYVCLFGPRDDAGDAPREPAECGECALQARSDRVRAELRHIVQPLVQVCQMLRKDLPLQVPSDPCRGLVCILLAYLGRVDQDEGVLPDMTGSL